MKKSTDSINTALIVAVIIVFLLLILSLPIIPINKSDKSSDNIIKPNIKSNSNKSKYLLGYMASYVY